MEVEEASKGEICKGEASKEESSKGHASSKGGESSFIKRLDEAQIVGRAGLTLLKTGGIAVDMKDHGWAKTYEAIKSELRLVDAEKEQLPKDVKQILILTNQILELQKKQYRKGRALAGGRKSNGDNGDSEGDENGGEENGNGGGLLGLVGAAWKVIRDYFSW